MSNFNSLESLQREVERLERALDDVIIERDRLQRVVDAAIAWKKHSDEGYEGLVWVGIVSRLKAAVDQYEREKDATK